MNNPETEALAAEVVRVCRALEAAGNDVTCGNDTARGIAVAAAVIRELVERELRCGS